MSLGGLTCTTGEYKGEPVSLVVMITHVLSQHEPQTRLLSRAMTPPPFMGCVLGSPEYKEKVRDTIRCYGKGCSKPKCLLAHGELRMTIEVPSPVGCCVPVSRKVFVNPPLPPDPPPGEEEEALLGPGVILNLGQLYAAPA